MWRPCARQSGECSPWNPLSPSTSAPTEHPQPGWCQGEPQTKPTAHNQTRLIEKPQPLNECKPPPTCSTAYPKLGPHQTAGCTYPPPCVPLPAYSGIPTYGGG